MVAFEAATPFRWFLCWAEASCGHSGLSPQLPLKTFANSGRNSHFYNRKSTPGASVHKVDFGKFCGGGRRDNGFAQWTCFLTPLPFLLPRVWCLPVLHRPPDVTTPKPSVSRDIRADCAWLTSHRHDQSPQQKQPGRGEVYFVLGIHRVESTTNSLVTDREKAGKGECQHWPWSPRWFWVSQVDGDDYASTDYV